MTALSQLMLLLSACAGLLLKAQAADHLDVVEVSSEDAELYPELVDEDAPNMSEELINSRRSIINAACSNNAQTGALL